MIPQLLVSVRNADEARAAIEGGCDILDIKEPSRGSLGRADTTTILDILNSLGPDAPPVSAALGELRDFHDSPVTASLPPGLAYVKLGLAGCATLPHWDSRLRDIREFMSGGTATPPMWVATLYADWELAGAPSIKQAFERLSSGYPITLIDTFTKDGRTLTDWIDLSQLRTFCIIRHSSHPRRQVALAGSLTKESLPKLADVPCDILAISTAACRNGDRNGPICPDAIRRFKDAMQRVFA